MKLHVKFISKILDQRTTTMIYRNVGRKTQDMADVAVIDFSDAWALRQYKSRIRLIGMLIMALHRYYRYIYEDSQNPYCRKEFQFWIQMRKDHVIRIFNLLLESTSYGGVIDDQKSGK